MALFGFAKGGTLQDITSVYERMQRDKYGALTPSPTVAVACFQRWAHSLSWLLEVAMALTYVVVYFWTASLLPAPLTKPPHC